MSYGFVREIKAKASAWTVLPPGEALNGSAERPDRERASIVRFLTGPYRSPERNGQGASSTGWTAKLACPTLK